MKKTIQKMLSVLIAITMIIVLGATAFAAENDITITKSPNDTATHKYEAYQIFTGTLDTDSTGATVLKDINWSTDVDPDAILTALGLPSTTTAGEAAAWIETNGDAHNIADLIKDCLTTPEDSKETDAASAVLHVTSPGYYFIKDTITSGTNGAVSNYIVQVVEDVDLDINAKVDVPSLNKSIVDNNTEVENNAVSVGDTVTYKITSTVPDTSEFTTYNFTVSDTLSAGLTFGSISSVKVGSSTLTAAEYTFNQSGQSFTLKLDDIMNYTAGDEITITYTATLNENCVLDTNANTNTANLQFSNDPNDSSSNGQTPDIVTKTYTTQLSINKVDGDGDPLPEAKFTLSGDAINTLIVTDKTGSHTEDCSTAKSYEAEVAADGTLTFAGIAPGTYTLHEEAPSGYNSVADMEVVIGCTFDATTGEPTWTYTVDGVDATSTLTIENTKASSLPSTGGIGTTVFYIAGGVLLAGGVALLIAKKKNTETK